MSNFTFDTSGEVYIPDVIHELGSTRIRWEDLSPFAQGYVEALFAQLVAESAEARWELVGFSDLAPEALAMVLRDCEVYERHHPMKPFAEYRRARGSAFWTERNSGKRTSDWAPVHFYPVAACLGDDGKVCLAPTTNDGEA